MSEETELSDAQINAVLDGIYPEFWDVPMGGTLQFARAIIAADRELRRGDTGVDPFGHFKAEPFGWTDCAETDEGAVALYEAPQPPPQKK